MCKDGSLWLIVPLNFYFMNKTANQMRKWLVCLFWLNWPYWFSASCQIFNNRELLGSRSAGRIEHSNFLRLTLTHK